MKELILECCGKPESQCRCNGKLIRIDLTKLRALSDEEIEEWLLNRLGQGNVFEQFNRRFCEDFSQATLSSVKEQLEEMLKS